MKESRKSIRQRRKAHDLEVKELDQSLQETRVLLAQAYVYEIQSLQARYSYLLRQRKALEPQVPDPMEAGLGEAAPLPVV